MNYVSLRNMSAPLAISATSDFLLTMPLASISSISVNGR